MGYEKNKQHEARDSKRTKTKDTAPWTRESDRTSTALWEDVDPLLVAYVVQAACDHGQSVQFTRSRDGGSLGVRVYDEELKTGTEWGRPHEDIDDLLFRIADYYREKAGKETKRWS